MPRGNGTGPFGMTRHNGRGAGFCAGFGMPGYMNPGAGFGYGFNRGGGRGFGGLCRVVGSWCPGGAYQGLAAGVESEMLVDRIRYMEQDLDKSKKRLAELQKEPNPVE
jgi:hypothetical protein